MAYINRLTDINTNLSSILNKQIIANTNINTITGTIQSINSNLITELNNINTSNTLMTNTFNTITLINDKLGATLNTSIHGRHISDSVPIKVNNLGEIYTVKNQLGSYANGLNDNMIETVSPWIDVSAYRYIICYYEDTNIDIIVNPNIEFAFTYDNLNIIDPNIEIILTTTSTKRIGRIDKLYIPSINYIRIKNNSSTTLDNVFFTITGCA